MARYKHYDYNQTNQFRKRDPRFADSITFNEAKAQRRKERGGQVAKRLRPIYSQRLGTVESVFGNL
ncbi:hypothetical protein [Nitrincola alkalisediminis]|uniref:hypothetical protein n=1 Tax=Nitrincola alkalisediminis TaxID=1366656 RepID=UPI0018768378|nr:hypothetical protein [Nitrincola alkalisediminis]